jgi:hypothetical protein
MLRFLPKIIFLEINMIITSSPDTWSRKITPEDSWEEKNARSDLFWC